MTDIAPGYDHITAAIGGTAAALYGASFLIAAHAGDVARGLKGAADSDRRISTARANLEWETHLAESLDPKTAKKNAHRVMRSNRPRKIRIG